MGGIVIQMPVGPSPVFALVVHQLEQVFGNTHLTWPNAWALGNIGHEHRARDDIHVASGSGGEFPGGGLD